jgi:hypothetical protein
MRPLLVEDDRLVSIAQNAAIEVPADGAGKDDALEVAAAGDEVFHLVAVRDACHVLLDDGAVVEHFGDVVAGGADQLDAARVGSMVGPRSGEGGKK